jgi:hypothetical protein
MIIEKNGNPLYEIDPFYFFYPLISRWINDTIFGGQYGYLWISFLDVCAQILRDQGINYYDFGGP